MKQKFSVSATIVIENPEGQRKFTEHAVERMVRTAILALFDDRRPVVTLSVVERPADK